MKRILIFVLAITLGVTQTNAQLFKVFGHDVGFVYVGPKVGMNLSKFSQWSYSNYTVKNRLGYQLGVVGELGFTNRFSVQSEIVLISKGAIGETAGITETKRMPSIQIPILARYTFSLLGLRKVYANGGVYSTTRVGSGTVIYSDGMSYNDYHWTRFDWGFSFGCGAEYPTKDGIWGLDLRYDLGAVDVYRQLDESTKSRFRSFQFSVTYKFDLVDIYFKYKNKKNRNDEVESEQGVQRPNGLKIQQRD
ncbi:porin family protein [Tenuifilum thalassicum]|uniref:PorT family protein n=1 Tax=Tenuifilum thalassicum TaxID=2590900 RepID=A0A7D4BJ89_9BACT|nr:porin family protein [Tenuifilum thalassicum]QKG79379.1 PorT family protein [Tenuifilum thalassicum]